MGNKSSYESLESQYPSVDLAYEFTKSSYDWMLNRYEAINSKMQELLTLATAITACMPILAKSMFDYVDFHSGLFYGVIGTYILIILIGISGLSMGAIRLIHPKHLYDKWLSDSSWEFKKNIIYYAGQDFEDNKKIIDRKSHLRNIMNIFLLVELLLIIFWIAEIG